VHAVRVFERAVRREGDRPFAFDRSTAVSYQEADERTDAVCGGLVRRGVSPGDTVAFCAADSVDLLLGIIGTWKAGALPSLIDPRTKEESLAYFVQDIEAGLTVAEPEHHDRLIRAGASSVIGLKDLGHDAVSAEVRHNEKAPLYLSYTSGTTGVPKGCILKSGSVTVGASCTADRLGLQRLDTLLVTTPTASSFQLVAALLPALHVGGTIGLASGSTTDEIWAIAREWKATVLVAYPLTLADMVNSAKSSLDSPFRLALSGGSPLSPRIKRDYQDVLGIALLESYGQSEFGGFMALGSPRDGAQSMQGYVGRPLPDRLALICDREGQEVPSGELGEVMVPEGYFAGYKNKPEATAQVLAGGLLRCGDVAVADDDGHIKVLGRTRERDNAEARGGFLRDVEDAYYEHPDVMHAAVVESKRDGRIRAFVELLVGSHADEDALTSFAAGRVSSGLHPTRTSILEAMPRTFSGKADRLRLAETDGT
jgi:long-chain acyl-CoA synthetase